MSSRLEDTLANRLLAFPRFRQRTKSRQTGTWWCDDPQFDIARHIKRIRLPGATDKAELERFVAKLAATPLDPSHPLWQFHIVEDYEGGAAIVARIHHAIADGIALIGVMLSLTDGYVGAAAPRAKLASAEDRRRLLAGSDLAGYGSRGGGLRASRPMSCADRGKRWPALPTRLKREARSLASLPICCSCRMTAPPA